MTQHQQDTRHDTDPWAGGTLVELTAAQCAGLLAEGHVGRIAWCTATGPVVLPVNYVFHDGAVWIRSTPYSALAREWGTGPLAFEVDQLDETTHTGWSVLVRGKPVRRRHDDRPDLPELVSWPAGPRPFLLSLDVREITGRRLLPA